MIYSLRIKTINYLNNFIVEMINTSLAEEIIVINIK